MPRRSSTAGSSSRTFAFDVAVERFVEPLTERGVELFLRLGCLFLGGFDVAGEVGRVAAAGGQPFQDLLFHQRRQFGVAFVASARVVIAAEVHLHAGQMSDDDAASICSTRLGEAIQRLAFPAHQLQQMGFRLYAGTEPGNQFQATCGRRPGRRRSALQIRKPRARSMHNQARSRSIDFSARFSQRSARSKSRSRRCDEAVQAVPVGAHLGRGLVPFGVLAEKLPGAERAVSFEAIAGVIVNRFVIGGRVAIGAQMQPAAEARRSELDDEPAAQQTGGRVRPILERAESLGPFQGLKIEAAGV